MTKPKTIVIVGGGLGGLTGAVALSQRGFRVRVFEDRLRDAIHGLSCTKAWISTSA